MSELLTLLGIATCLISGIPGMFLNRRSMIGQWAAALFNLMGSVLGLGGIALFWATGRSQPITLSWLIPGGAFAVAMDGLSAIFLVPIFLISLLGSIYGLGYWKQTEHPENGRKLRFFYGTLTAGMALLVIARNSILFLFGWEIMALSAFFLVATEDQDKDVREASWIYLVATHAATLFLFAFFALLRSASGTFDMVGLDQDHLRPGTATAIFVLALCGFGLKAGIMPLHVWLPGAHAMAPSHVSAMMSGVLIKMGIYGLVRATSLLPQPPVQWGAAVLALGVISGVLGVAFAIGQHDLKRLLAYHSIENIGIIAMGLGLALLGRSEARPDWIILGLSGCLLHVWNHAFFKALLFLSAGSVIHQVKTREIDRLGGLAKSMPFTATCFLAGSVAICGLPPLNGFVSEFFIYLGLFNSAADSQGVLLTATAFAAPALALIGALALACFVKVYGAVFLGTARSEYARDVHESPRAMLGPMAVLVGCCFLVGLAPMLVVRPLAMGISAWIPELGDPGPRLAQFAPLYWITIMGLLLIGALSLLLVLLRMMLHRPAVQYGPTWGCGYMMPSPRMQYTSSSFAQTLVGLFAWILRPRKYYLKGMAMFPSQSHFHTVVPDMVLDEGVLPAFRFGAWLFSCFRVFQQGNVQTYLLYIFIALIAFLLWR